MATRQHVTTPLRGGGEILAENMDKDIRLGFIRKVYGILACQILVTILITLPFQTSKAFTDYVAGNQWLVGVSAFLSIAVLCAFMCCRDAAREYPTNYALLGAFTVCEGFMIGVITSAYETKSVMEAFGITLFVVVGLTLYAMHTEKDFTGMGPYLFVACLVFIGFSFLMIFIPSETGHRIFAGFGTLLFSLYLVYDTQIVAGGKHREHQLSVDDYVFGALVLYIDIIQIFIHILQMMGNRN